jgi:hypothetical protein
MSTESKDTVSRRQVFNAHAICRSSNAARVAGHARVVAGRIRSLYEMKQARNKVRQDTMAIDYSL